MTLVPKIAGGGPWAQIPPGVCVIRCAWLQNSAAERELA